MGVKEKDDAEPPPGRGGDLVRRQRQSVVTVDGKEGIFTKAVIDGLKGAADNDGYEPDGVVTIDELNKYLENEVSQPLPQNTARRKKPSSNCRSTWPRRATTFFRRTPRSPPRSRNG